MESVKRGDDGQLRRRGAIWWTHYSQQGKRYEESSGSAKKQNALALLKRKEGDIASGVPVPPDTLTFDDAIGT